MPPRIRPTIQCCSSIVQLSTRPATQSSFLGGIFPQRFASVLNSIADTPGAYNKRIRKGRGPGSGKGKTAGRGHKGQKQHGKVPAGFQGGQTPLEVVKGKRGFENPFSEDMAQLNLDRLQSWVDQGRLNPSKPITVVELVKSGCLNRVRDGIKLLARGSEHVKTPLHIVVSRASASAIEAIERAGGSITTRYYTEDSIKRILAGKAHPIHSRQFRPTPITNLAVPEDRAFEHALSDPTQRKDIEYYRDAAHRGYLSYQVPDGHGPSLFFRTPGTGTGEGAKKRSGPKKDAGENRIW